MKEDKTMRIKHIIAAAAFAAFSLLSPIISSAEQRNDNELFSEIEAESVCIVECQTQTLLYERNADEPRPMRHMAKLMTVLIAAEAIDNGELSLDDEVTVSSNANSKQGTQIWLDIGERISVEELLKSIIIGNANDGCTALGEHLSGSEEKHVERLNDKAAALGMNATHFADCCGIDPDTVSSAADIALLSSNIVKYDSLTEYFTTWMDNVRGQAVELVNNNRLVRSYKGIIGLKACASEAAGECITAAAKRGNLTVCAVLLGCGTGDNKIYSARDSLDAAFENYRCFMPELDDEWLKDIPVLNGQKFTVGVKAEGYKGIIVRAGTAGGIEPEVSLAEEVTAPVKKGDVLGNVKYLRDGELLVEVDICAKEDVKQMSFAFALKRSLLNLLGFKR